ncbi:hypothetical protein BAC1_01580 [uncultured bacterium]|nr:hypothetical protein BAC1_01580 [uncultured bacterium]
MKRHGRSSRGARGFTLLEVLLVLVIFSIAAALTAPVVGRGIGSAETRTAAKRLGAAMNHAKALAVRERANHYVEVMEGKILVASADGHLKREFTLSKGVSVSGIPARAVFTSRGGANAGEYSVKGDGGAEFTVKVSSSGHVRVEGNPAGAD